MGCRPSKLTRSLPPIDSNFPNTGHFDLDVFFLKASQLLQRIETLRTKIYVTKQRGAVLAGTSIVPVDPYTKAVEVLFWSLSAARRGQIAMNHIVISQGSPFVTANLQGTAKDTNDLFTTLQEYISILNETPENVRDMVNQLQTIREEQAEVKRIAEPKMPPKAVKICNDNMRKLNDGIAVSAKVLSQVPEEQSSALELIKYMQGLINTSDEIGLRAFDAGLARPAEIFKWIELENRKNERRKRADASVEKKRAEKAQKNKKGAPIDSNNKEEPKGNHIQNYLANPDDVVIQNKPIGNSDIQQADGTLKPSETQGSIGKPNGAVQEGLGGHMVQSFGSPKKNEGGNIENGHYKNEANQKNGQLENPKAHANLYEVGSRHFDDSHNLSSLANKEIQHENKERLLHAIDPNISQKALENKVYDHQYKEMVRTKDTRMSPNGNKKHTILPQGEENILDEDTTHALANDSVMIKNFIEKAQSYLELKD